MEDALRQAVEAAAGRAEVGAAVQAVYAVVAAEVDSRRPLCDASGRCCRFEEYGHRLYVTTLELATFARQLRVVSSQVPVKTDRSHPVRSLPLLATGNWPLATSSWNGSGCPFQLAKLCGVHAIRPFGCRMYFCDASSTEWQNEAYERFHGELKALHGTLDVPYFYVEWRQALGTMGWASPAAMSGAERSF